MKKVLFVFGLCFIVFIGRGQKIYSLEECIDQALRNSSRTQLAALALRDAEVDVTRANQLRLPNANAGLGHGLNFGRSIDPSTNTFITEQITRGGFSGSAYLPLWQDGQLIKNAKSFKYASEASALSLKNEVIGLKFQVALAYMQLLSNKEIAVRAELQEKTTNNQLERLKVLSKQGSIVPSQLADMQGQLAQDQLNTLASKQQVKASKLSLAQLMNIKYDESMDIKNDQNNVPAPDIDMNNKLANALTEHPMIKAQELQIKSAEMGLAAAKSSRYPQLGISFNLGSSYSSAFKLNNAEVGYPKQLSNNFNYSTLLSVDVPILNGYRTRMNIKKAENAIERAKSNYDLAKNTIQQQIEEAKFQLDNAVEKYRLSEAQVKSFEESFHIAETRFNNGVTNSTVEYIIAKNNYDRSQNQLISAKYEWAIRNKIVEYFESLR